MSTVQHLLAMGSVAVQVALTLNLGFSCQRSRVPFTPLNATVASQKSPRVSACWQGFLCSLSGAVMETSSARLGTASAFVRFCLSMSLLSTCTIIFLGHVALCLVLPSKSSSTQIIRGDGCGNKGGIISYR